MYPFINFKFSNEFIFYEQFESVVGTFSIANASLMVLLSGMTLKLIFLFNPDTNMDETSNKGVISDHAQNHDLQV